MADARTDMVGGLAELADALVREFRAPVGLADPESGAWLHRSGPDDLPWPDPAAVLSPAGPRAATDRDDVALWPAAGHRGACWLVLPLGDADGKDVRALVGFGPLDARDDGRWGPPCPRRALRLWGRDVAAEWRARGGSSSRSRARVREAFLLDRLIRGLRVSDAPERFQRLAVTGLRDELGFEAVAWVPAQGRDPVTLSHESAAPSPTVLRALAATASQEGPRIVRRPPEAPELELAVIAVADHENPAGWVVAWNPTTGRAPGRAGLELMQLVALLIGTQRSNARLYGDLKDLLFGVIRALTAAIDAKDPYTCGHSERVARIAARLGEHLGMSPNRCGDLYLMGLLHDVGKIGVDDVVLKKPGKLSPDEYRIIQSHVRIGVRILTDLRKLSHLLPGVAYHHESFDGRGYPEGLAGEAIPLPARILAVADSYDAMSSTRPYRERLGLGKIEEIFREGAGRQWDPAVVEAFFACRADIQSIREKGLGKSLVEVVDNTLGRF